MARKKANLKRKSTIKLRAGKGYVTIRVTNNNMTQTEWPFSLGILVGARGFEPPTSRSRMKRGREN